MKSILSSILLSFTLLSMACNAKTVSSSKPNESEVQIPDTNKPTNLSSYQKAYFASGCFWCVEAVFESVKGVKEAISGYAGGKEKNPTYSDVGSGLTGHTESVEVYYDSTEISYKTLVKVFYGSHDPTTVDGQHPDYGKQYRSAIFYTSSYQKEIAISFKDSLEKSGIYTKPLVT